MEMFETAQRKMMLLKLNLILMRKAGLFLGHHAGGD